ncbi:CBS domain-containing protein CBSX2, chloroplastic-like [Hibiscus syriacus]|uniref:CBS domain-containing protein CBSX2, chloroplastic-like n=1 Tax=Hibiscus syriacus TaxID=106335 RepID=UPI001923A52C|nr:CBS domain-containing protein CBSX2, chloroplastic-like [Hibiscus syriacus]
MASISLANFQTLKLFPSLNSFLHSKQPCIVSLYHHPDKVVPSLSLSKPKGDSFHPAVGLIANSVPSRNGNYTVGDFMTRKKDLHVVKATTSVNEVLEALVERRVTGFPMIDDEWNLRFFSWREDGLGVDYCSRIGNSEL